MRERAFETARIDDLERPDGWSPIRLQLGVQAFGINAWTGHEAEATLVPEHDEEPTGHEELYLVTAGHASFTVGGEAIDAPAGTIVFVRDPAAKRGAVAREAGTTVLSVGAKPGEAYRPRSWETNRDVFALLDSGKNAEAKQLLRRRPRALRRSRDAPLQPGLRRGAARRDGRCARASPSRSRRLAVPRRIRARGRRPRADPRRPAFRRDRHCFLSRCDARCLAMRRASRPTPPTFSDVNACRKSRPTK